MNGFLNEEALIEQAKAAKEQAYAPYSGFSVGAALLCADGSVYTGCNIENASYGAAVCAERTAVFKAVSEGKREFVMLAIISDSESFTAPCGICRQVLAEFCPDEMPILMCDRNGAYRTQTLKELLPEAFRL